MDTIPDQSATFSEASFPPLVMTITFGKTRTTEQKVVNHLLGGYLLLLWLMGPVDKGWLNPSELFPLLLSRCNVRGLQKDATVYFFYDQHFSAKKCKNENGETCPLWTEIKTWEDMKCTIKKIIWTIWTFFATFLDSTKEKETKQIAF